MPQQHIRNRQCQKWNAEDLKAALEQWESNFYSSLIHISVTHSMVYVSFEASSINCERIKVFDTNYYSIAELHA